MKGGVLAAALLLSALAGCFADDPERTATSDADDAADDAAPPLRLPGNRTGTFAAFDETNVTDDLGFHAHDYWNGRARVPLLDAPGELYPYDLADTFRPPEGALVYEGAGQVEVTVSQPARRVCEPFFAWRNGPGGVWNKDGVACTPAAPDPAPPTLRLQFLHAASGPDDWIEAGELAWGQPLVIAVQDAKWTDMPHSAASLWRLRVVASEPLDGTLAFRIAATVARAEVEVPKWPGHPVFYRDGQHYRLVFDGEGETEETGVEGAFQTKSARHVPGKLISAGTKSLLVFVNITSVEGQPAPTHWYLRFHNTTGDWNLTSVRSDNVTADRTSLAWTLHVDPQGMDSPYATASRWRFELGGAHLLGGQSGIACFGCATYKVRYHLTVVATDLEPAAYSPT